MPDPDAAPSSKPMTVTLSTRTLEAITACWAAIDTPSPFLFLQAAYFVTLDIAEEHVNTPFGRRLAEAMVLAMAVRQDPTVTPESEGEA